jgi:hypothetical protein
VSHLLRDGGHRQDFVMIERCEKEKLREGNVTRREFLGEMQNETTLHFQDDVGEAFGVSPKFVDPIEPKLSRRFQTA